MSKGTVHTLASISLATGFLVGAFEASSADDLQYVIGALVGVAITPDVDVDAGYITDAYIRAKAGKWVEKYLWDPFWKSYRKSVKHGSALSHAPVLGTSGRIAYMYWQLIAMPHVVVHLVFSPSWSLWDALSFFAMWIVAHYKIVLALMGADAIHWALDLATTEHKETKDESNNRVIRQSYGNHRSKSFGSRSRSELSERISF